MNKLYVTVGVVAAVILIVAATSPRSSTLSSDAESVTAASADAVLAGKTAIVTLTDRGFKPAVVKVERGASIKFINQSGNAMRITPLKDPKDDTSEYLGFASTRSYGRGGTYGVTVTKPGIWGYKNLNNANLVGIVIVEN